MDSVSRRRTRAWRIAFWAMWAGFIVTAALNMLHVHGGVLTNHAADVIVPALLYVMLRGLANPGRSTLLGRLFGRTPEHAAAVLFVCSALTELSQRFWPHGIFAGRFDPLDIPAFALGLAICYVCDKRWPSMPPAAAAAASARGRP